MSQDSAPEPTEVFNVFDMAHNNRQVAPGIDLLPGIIHRIADRLGREPTEEEVYNFIFGSEAQRQEIWKGDPSE